MTINPFIERIYSGAAQEEEVDASGVEAVLSDLYDEMAKYAQAEGYNMEDAFTDDEIAQLMQDHIAESGGIEKVAEALGYNLTDGSEDGAPDLEEVDLEKVASYFGRVAAQSMRKELSGEGELEIPTMEKLASLDEDELGDYVEKLAHERAYALLRQAHDTMARDAEIMETFDEEDWEKVAHLEQLEDALLERAFEILDENGYSVRSILEVLS